ncbi:hypothetical protein K458DRAFT_128354 [Lentithecium fluviatile CBS 122367]|uniref:Uncharacterized protein n=1 Tax=Lentithecium fluviatile CBS 122367 TaxID=1168545 RepID=A0A6G1JGW6_9PLEO|nr:hypothetical protein K458DRAFT_128354 [Lentithecium fluviatile CBS 122367]
MVDAVNDAAVKDEMLAERKVQGHDETSTLGSGAAAEQGSHMDQVPHKAPARPQRNNLNAASTHCRSHDRLGNATRGLTPFVQLHAKRAGRWQTLIHISVPPYRLTFLHVLLLMLDRLRRVLLLSIHNTESPTSPNWISYAVEVISPKSRDHQNLKPSVSSA